ncbi:murein biosynthesis integral membrane protein MurJ [Tissierella sp.]|uniref:murein biosynthesis integral membrane protein MurJ n=1 Tax=Tissierella sp. TaxID=41274 RepID=UPI0028A8C22B|nr:murein biosynthesis integral membrane protein MurJ [Tissierella sp.]
MKRKTAMKKSTLYIIYFGIATKILYFIKEILTASKIGANYKMDSYLLAFSTVMLFTGLISDGIIIAIIPLLQEIQERHGIERKINYTNNLINITILFSFIIILIGFIGAPCIIGIFGPGFKGEELNDTIQLFRIGLPIISLSWLNAIFGGFLQSVHSFKGGPKGRFASGVLYIIYLLFFAKTFALKGFMLVGTIAGIFQIYIFRKGLRANGFKYSWHFDLKDKYIKKLRYYLIPIIAGVGINELNTSIDNAVASTLSVGSIAELSYAKGIMNLFLGVFIAAIVTVIFPVLSEDYNKDDEEHFKNEIRNGMKLLTIISIPVSIILIIMSKPIVRIIFQRGAFDVNASILTSKVLSYYGFGLAAMAIIPLITRAYYSIQDMKTPVLISLVALVLNTILNLSLSPIMGIGGIALGTSISIILALLYGIFDLNQKLQIIEGENLKDILPKIEIATLVMAGTVFLAHITISTLLNDLLLADIIDVLLSTIIGIVVYVTVYKVSPVKE